MEKEKSCFELLTQGVFLVLAFVFFGFPIVYVSIDWWIENLDMVIGSFK